MTRNTQLRVVASEPWVSRSVSAAEDVVLSLPSLLTAAQANDCRLAVEAACRRSEQRPVCRLDLSARAWGVRLQEILVARFSVTSAALSRRVLPPSFHRILTGNVAALHSGAQVTSADLAVTVFLTPPAYYEGGELLFAADATTRCRKADAGDAVLHPVSLIARLTAVTRGSNVLATLLLKPACAGDRGLRVMPHR